MTLQLYGAKMGSSLRCHWLLKELNLPYEEMPLDMRAGEHKQAAFLAINPAGQVPTLIHDGFVIAESYAINAYLIELAGSDLGGTTAQERAKVWQWSLYALTSVQPHFATLANPIWTGVQDAGAEEKARAMLVKRLPVVDTHLATNAYLAGDRFTVADINVAAMLTYADLVKFDLSQYPHIVAWRQRVTDRPAYRSLVSMS